MTRGGAWVGRWSLLVAAAAAAPGAVELRPKTAVMKEEECDSNLRAMASNLRAMASTLVAMASTKSDGM